MYIATMLQISRRIILAMTMAVVFRYVDSNQRIIHISELISDDKDFFTSGEDDNSHTCCVYGNCTCNSLDHALANLTSNVLINITSDAMLSSLTEVSDLQNVSIIGHNHPTLNCKRVGRIHFTFCYNCIIQGIIWDGCGAEITDDFTEPVLKLNYSFNITIQDCSFQHSMGQALVLSKILGDCNINNCNFVNNSHYRGHGAAIHYSYMYNAKKSSHDQFLFAVNICTFTNNQHIRNLVYIENGLFIKYHKIFLSNSMFSGNQGISVYVINHNIYINGKVLFKNSVAVDGAGIYISDHSTVMFGENSNTKFINNTVYSKGAAIFIYYNSNIVFGNDSIANFIDNKASNGTIYSKYSSNVVFKGTCNVTFRRNSATQYGAAIYSFDNSQVIFTGNATASFNNNAVSSNAHLQHGGTILSENNGHISFEENSIAVFNTNSAGFGAAILSISNSNVIFKDNS